MSYCTKWSAVAPWRKIAWEHIGRKLLESLLPSARPHWQTRVTICLSAWQCKQYSYLSLQWFLLGWMFLRDGSTADSMLPVLFLWSFNATTQLLSTSLWLRWRLRNYSWSTESPRRDSFVDSLIITRHHNYMQEPHLRNGPKGSNILRFIWTSDFNSNWATWSTSWSLERKNVQLWAK